MSKFNEIISLIDKNVLIHKKMSDSSDFSDIEIIEFEILYEIFNYCYEIGIKIEDYDLGRILSAEDDDDEGVPPEGIHQALLNLQLRMIEPDVPNPIQIPLEVKKLFEYYEQSFWPDLHEIRNSLHD